MSAARANDCRGDLHRIVAPTLVVRGEEDPFISTATAAWTVDHINDAKLVLVPEAWHSLKRHPCAGGSPITRTFVLIHPTLTIYFSAIYFSSVNNGKKKR